MSKVALQLIAQAKKDHATCLDLGNCGLTEIPHELFELVWLEELFYPRSHALRGNAYDLDYTE